MRLSSCNCGRRVRYCNPWSSMAVSARSRCVRPGSTCSSFRASLVMAVDASRNFESWPQRWSCSTPWFVIRVWLRSSSTYFSPRFEQPLVGDPRAAQAEGGQLSQLFQVLQSLIRDRGFVQVEALEIRQSGQQLDPLIAHFGRFQVEFHELGRSLKLAHALARDARAAEEQRLQVLQGSQGRQAVVGHAGSGQVQDAQVGEAGEVLQPRPGDARLAELQGDELHPLQVLQAGVRDLRPFEVEVLQVVQFLKVAEPDVGRLRSAQEQGLQALLVLQAKPGRRR